MCKKLGVLKLLVTFVVFSLTALSGEDRNMIGKLEKEYKEFKAGQAKLLSVYDYVTEMENLSISARVFSDEGAKDSFYSELKQKKDQFYSEIFKSWTPDEIQQLKSELSKIESVNYLFSGAMEYLSETN